MLRRAGRSCPCWCGHRRGMEAICRRIRHRSANLITSRASHEDAPARPLRPHVPPLCFGGNVFGWTVDEADLVPAARRLPRRRVQLHRHRRRLFALGARPQGGESETIIGNWLKARGKRDRVVIATKVGMEMGRRQGPVGRTTSRGPSRSRCGGCRPTTSTSTSRTRTTRRRRRRRRSAAYDGADQGRARCGRSAPRTSRPSGSQRRCDMRRANGLPRYESLQPRLQPRRAAELRGRAASRVCVEKRRRRDPLLLARRRLPHRQVPLGGRLRQEPARRARHEKYLNPRGMRILAGARRGRRGDTAPSRPRSRWPG